MIDSPDDLYFLEGSSQFLNIIKLGTLQCIDCFTFIILYLDDRCAVATAYFAGSSESLLELLVLYACHSGGWVVAYDKIEGTLDFGILFYIPIFSYNQSVYTNISIH